MKREVVGEMQIILSDIFYGLSYIGERYAMIFGLGPMTFLAGRYVVKLLSLLMIRPLLKNVGTAEVEKYDRSCFQEVDLIVENEDYMKRLFFYGILAGISGFAASALQQIALVNVSAGKTGFVLGMSVILVPILEWLIPQLKGEFSWYTLLAAILNIAGLYLLVGCASASSCFDGGFGYGELWLLLSMFGWTANIIISSVGCKVVNTISLLLISFTVILFLSVISSVAFEMRYFDYPFVAIKKCWWLIISE